MSLCPTQSRTPNASWRVFTPMLPVARSILACRPAVHDTQWGHPLHRLDATPETRSHYPFLGEDVPRDRSQQLNTHITNCQELCYPWHPWYGRTVVIHETYVRRGQTVFKSSLDTENGGRPIAIPAWMFDRALCATLRLSDRPLISFDALLELHALVKSQFSTDDEDRIVVASLSSLIKGVPDANSSSPSPHSPITPSTPEPVPPDVANSPRRGPTDHYRASRLSVATSPKCQPSRPQGSGGDH